MMRHIFVGIDLGDKNSVARIAVDRDKSERFGFVNDVRGRARLFEKVKVKSEEAEGAKIIMAYEASSCGFILRDEAEARGNQCCVLAPTKMEKSVEQRKHKNDDRDAVDVLEKIRAHVLGHLSIKLCLKAASSSALKAGLEHRIELRQRRVDAVIGGSPLSIFKG